MMRTDPQNQHPRIDASWGRHCSWLSAQTPNLLSTKDFVKAPTNTAGQFEEFGASSDQINPVPLPGPLNKALTQSIA